MPELSGIVDGLGGVLCDAIVASAPDAPAGGTEDDDTTLVDERAAEVWVCSFGDAAVDSLASETEPFCALLPVPCTAPPIAGGRLLLGGD